MTQHVQPSIAAIVLAGGKSSRMQRDKALLTLNGQTMLSRICTIAATCATQVYVVTPWTAKYRHILPPGCQLITETLLSPATKTNSPLIGFAQGLRHIKTEWVLLLACDLARLNSSQVKQWSENLATVLPTEIAFLPRHAKGYEPLCGFYRRRCLPSLAAYIEAGGKSFQGWLSQQQVRVIPVSDRSCLFNCNTIEDWQLVTSSEFKIDHE